MVTVFVSGLTYTNTWPWTSLEMLLVKTRKRMIQQNSRYLYVMISLAVGPSGKLLKGVSDIKGNLRLLVL